MSITIDEQTPQEPESPLVSAPRPRHVLSRALYEAATLAHHCWCGHGHEIALDEVGEPSSRCQSCSPADLVRRWKTFRDSPEARPDPVSLAVVAAVRTAEDIVSGAVAAPWVLVDVVHARVYDWLMAKTILGQMLR